MFYAPVHPNRTSSLDAWAKKYAMTGRARDLRKGGRELAASRRPLPRRSTDTHAAIETDITTSIPVAGLRPNEARKGYVLALESAAYAALLAAVACERLQRCD